MTRAWRWRGGYEFQDWQRLEEYVASVQQPGPIARFERAVEAVIDGDIATLKQLLADDPELVRAPLDTRQPFRSADASIDAAALSRRRTASRLSPALAEERARSANGPARCRRRSQRVVLGVRRQCTTMALLVSSTHRRRAGCKCRWSRR
jgi:hypothetical protein